MIDNKKGEVCEGLSLFRCVLAGTCGNRTHPSRGDSGRNGFEDRGGHQAPMHSRLIKAYSYIISYTTLIILFWNVFRNVVLVTIWWHETRHSVRRAIDRQIAVYEARVSLSDRSPIYQKLALLSMNFCKESGICRSNLFQPQIRLDFNDKPCAWLGVDSLQNKPQKTVASTKNSHSPRFTVSLRNATLQPNLLLHLTTWLRRRNVPNVSIVYSNYLN